MQYLPEVLEDIRYSVSESLSNYKADKDTVRSELKKIKRENPLVAQFIKNWAKQCKKNAIPVALSGIIVYKMLRSQAEANQMNKDFS